MRRRQRRQFKTVLASLMVASAVGFLFQDGLEFPKAQPLSLEPIAQARDMVASALQESVQVFKTPSSNVLIMPPGFHPFWEEQSLDHGQIHLKMLQHFYSVGETSQGLGAEYFPYGAYLFEQIGKQVKSPSLAQKLKTLSVEAQALGNTLREAGQLRYDGPPVTNMKHLEVHETLLALVKNLSSNTIHTAYDEKGHLLEQKSALCKNTPGESLKSFIDKSQALLQDPSIQAYPETLKVIHQQSQWLSRIASHITLRWDNTHYCPGRCTGVAHVRIYAQQTLPHAENPNTLAASFSRNEFGRRH